MTLSSVFVQRDGKERTVKVSDDKMPLNIDDDDNVIMLVFVI